MAFTLRKAERSSSIPLIGLHGKSGTGKTFSALLLARGYVGPEGKIGMVDTEQGRGSLYADQIPGGYLVGELTRFSPADYIEAINAVEAAEIDILVIDSASHEWEGEGGVRDMAAANEAKSGKVGLHNWIKPKAEHSKFVQRLLRTKIPVIVCLRGKQKTKQVKVRKKGRMVTEVVKDDFTTPIADEDFMFEMTAYMEVLQDHSINLQKWSHPDLKPCFPTEGPITIETGQQIAEWAKGSKNSVNSSGEDGRTAQSSKNSTPDSLEGGEQAAQNGLQALQEWWKSLPDDEKRALASEKDRLKGVANDADQSRFFDAIGSADSETDITQTWDQFEPWLKTLDDDTYNNMTQFYEEKRLQLI